MIGQRTKQRGAVSLLVMTLIGAALGVLNFVGNKTTQHNAKLEMHKTDAHTDYQKQCFDSQGNPRSPEWCQGLNQFNDKLVFPQKNVKAVPLLEENK